MSCFPVINRWVRGHGLKRQVKLRCFSCSHMGFGACWKAHLLFLQPKQATPPGRPLPAPPPRRVRCSVLAAMSTWTLRPPPALAPGCRPSPRPCRSARPRLFLQDPTPHSVRTEPGFAGFPSNWALPVSQTENQSWNVPKKTNQSRTGGGLVRILVQNRTEQNNRISPVLFRP